MEQPILFLDIDGVLALFDNFMSNKQSWHKKFQCYKFDDKCVKTINVIVEAINPTIVLSSDWKLQYSIEEMNEIFEWNGINAKISDFTPILWGVEYFKLEQLEECRAKEILEYVKRNNVQKYVAVDDLDLKPWIPDNFVHTPRVMEGIKQSGVKNRILKILQ